MFYFLQRNKTKTRHEYLESCRVSQGKTARLLESVLWVPMFRTCFFQKDFLSYTSSQRFTSAQIFWGKIIVFFWIWATVLEAISWNKTILPPREITAVLRDNAQWVFKRCQTSPRQDIYFWGKLRIFSFEIFRYFRFNSLKSSEMFEAKYSQFSQ